MKEIPGGSRILLDTVTLIYHLERHPEHGPAASDLMRRIEVGDLEAIVSSLAITELLVHPYRGGREDLAIEVLRTLSTYPHLGIVDLDAAVADRAARVRAEHRLRTPDAIHAATALEEEVDGLVTNDRSFSNLEAEGIRVWLFDTS